MPIAPQTSSLSASNRIFASMVEGGILFPVAVGTDAVTNRFCKVFGKAVSGQKRKCLIGADIGVIEAWVRKLFGPSDIVQKAGADQDIIIDVPLRFCNGKGRI